MGSYELSSNKMLYDQLELSISYLNVLGKL
jgi:hypothetical protein